MSEHLMQLRRAHELVGRLTEELYGSGTAAATTLCGADAIDAAYRGLCRDAQEFIRECHRPPSALDHRTDAGAAPWRDAADRGVHCHSVIDASLMADRRGQGLLSRNEPGTTARQRLHPHVPFQLALFDDHSALLRLPRAAPRDEALLVLAPSVLLEVLLAGFEALWDVAEPLPGTRTEVGATGRGIVALLATGASDESISRQMSWSVRTTQRRIKDVMDEFGVVTRFQAGVLAAKHGWI